MFGSIRVKTGVVVGGTELGSRSRRRGHEQCNGAENDCGTGHYGSPLFTLRRLIANANRVVARP
jgi:hypothetical protein